MAADLDKLASLVGICGFLMQTKAAFLVSKRDADGTQAEFSLSTHS
jgi:hypothetical protein